VPHPEDGEDRTHPPTILTLKLPNYASDGFSLQLQAVMADGYVAAADAGSLCGEFVVASLPIELQPVTVELTLCGSILSEDDKLMLTKDLAIALDVSVDRFAVLTDRPLRNAVGHILPKRLVVLSILPDSSPEATASSSVPALARELSAQVYDQNSALYHSTTGMRLVSTLRSVEAAADGSFEWARSVRPILARQPQQNLPLVPGMPALVCCFN